MALLGQRLASAASLNKSRLAAVALLVSLFIIYYIYYLRYLAAVIAICTRQWSFGPQDLAVVTNEGPSGIWMYGFLIALVPVVLTRLEWLPLHLALLGIFDVIALASLIDPTSTINECPISGGGNHDDFYGDFVNYSLFYFLLNVILYIALILDFILRRISPKD